MEYTNKTKYTALIEDILMIPTIVPDINKEKYTFTVITMPAGLSFNISTAIINGTLENDHVKEIVIEIKGERVYNYKLVIEIESKIKIN